MKDWRTIYQEVLDAVLTHGKPCAPRQQPIVELLGVQFTIPQAQRTLLIDPIRDLNYRFMVAEWLWIAGGLNELRHLTRFNSNYGNYSDDSKTLAGAYGPRLWPQWDYLVEALRADPDTRQAVASIWTPNPMPSKDIPCTLSVQFLLRDGSLHSIWTMRSSDLWLGLPYDVWTFSMLQNALAGELGVEIGSLTMQLGSAHVYAQHVADARALIASTSGWAEFNVPLRGLVKRQQAINALEGNRELLVLDDCFDRYRRALREKTKANCLAVLLG